MRRPTSDIQDGRLLAALDRHLPPIIARSIVERARREATAGPDVSWTSPNGLLDRIAVGVRLFAAPERVAAILRDVTDLALDDPEAPATPAPPRAANLSLRQAAPAGMPVVAGGGFSSTTPQPTPRPVLPPYPQAGAPGETRESTVTLLEERDLPRARQMAREVCEALGARGLRQQLLITIVSELGRNMVLYAGGGTITFRPPTGSSRLVVVLAVDKGPGIANLSEIMAGTHKSRTGLGVGLVGIKRVASSFHIDTGRNGTTISVEMMV